MPRRRGCSSRHSHSKSRKYFGHAAKDCAKRNRKGSDPHLLAPQRPQTMEQQFCRFEIGRLKSLGEPIVHRGQDFTRRFGAVLVAPQSGEARGGTQLPGQGALPASPVQGLPEVIFGRLGGAGSALRQKKLALDPQPLGRRSN
jgi:hypothetical protein